MAPPWDPKSIDKVLSVVAVTAVRRGARVACAKCFALGLARAAIKLALASRAPPRPWGPKSLKSCPKVSEWRPHS